MNTIIALLISATQLLAIVQSTPNLPEDFKVYASEVANMAIVQAKDEIKRLEGEKVLIVNENKTMSEPTIESKKPLQITSVLFQSGKKGNLIDVISSNELSTTTVYTHGSDESKEVKLNLSNMYTDGKYHYIGSIDELPQYFTAKIEDDSFEPFTSKMWRKTNFGFEECAVDYCPE